MKRIILFFALSFVFSYSNCQWQKIESFPKTWIRCFVVSDEKIFAGCNDGVYLSTDRCVHWRKIDESLWDIHVHSLCACGNKLFAGTVRGVFVSEDHGKSWKVLNEGLI